MDPILEIVNNIKNYVDEKNKNKNQEMINLYKQLLLCREKQKKNNFNPLYHLFLKNITSIHHLLLFNNNINLQKRLFKLQTIILSF